MIPATQPLQNKRAGEGTRHRDVEEYLIGILREATSSSTLDQGGPNEGGSAEYDAKADILMRRKPLH